MTAGPPAISQEYSKYWNAYDSLGEAYMNAKQNDLAIQNYRYRSLSNPTTKWHRHVEGVETAAAALIRVARPKHIRKAVAALSLNFVVFQNSSDL
jgi:hypothetical protein